MTTWQQCEIILFYFYNKLFSDSYKKPPSILKNLEACNNTFYRKTKYKCYFYVSQNVFFIHLLSILPYNISYENISNIIIINSNVSTP